VSRMVGSMVSHYHLKEELGTGGMGVVYKAHDTRLDRLVAIKFLSAASVTDKERKRFVTEAQSAAGIHHPNICPIYEIGEHQGQLFFVMALVDGKTISDKVHDGPLPIDKALDITIQVAAGLGKAHRHGVVHRDIKSANIVVDGDGHAWILDFGVAQRQDSNLTASGTIVGTPAYMSPEQAQGLPVDHRSDLWSLAVVLFEMLTGQVPFHGSSHYSVLHAIVTEDPHSVSSLRSGIPKRIVQFMTEAFAKDRDKRWQSAAEMAEELSQIREALLAETETVASYMVAHADTARGTSGPEISRMVWHKRTSLLVAVALFSIVVLFWGIRRLRPSEALPGEKRIAVLPFTIVGTDAEMQPLADGLMETLTSKLSEIDDLQKSLMVVPASEVRSRNINSAEAALRIYGANLVITGNLQRWGDRIQFTMNLVDTAKVRQIASRTFDFEPTQLIALRDGAVNGAIQLCALKLSPQAGNSLAAGETDKSNAYQEYLKGTGYLARYDLPGNIDHAITSLTQAVRIDANYARAFAALGQAHWKKAVRESSTSEAQLALENIQNAIRLDPVSVDARVKRGEIYSESGKPEEAIRELESVLQTAPESAEAYRALGGAYEAAQQLKQAETAYRQAVQSQPTDWYGHLLLGLFYYRQGRDAEAQKAWEEARKLTPDNEVIYRNLAVLSLRQGDFRQASDMLSKAIRFEPNQSTYNTLAIAYYYQRRYQEAASALKTAIDLDPNHYSSWGNLGTVRRHIPGSAEQAKDDFRQAIELANRVLLVTKSDNNTHANLAEYWAKLGERDKALAEIGQIAPPARGPFLDRIILAYELTGNRSLALAALGSIGAHDPILTLIKNDPDLENLWRASSR
jgi:tetratricopeptide (TPR) repeat protein/predicted Ser/Thr protein kinase